MTRVFAVVLAAVMLCGVALGQDPVVKEENGWTASLLGNDDMLLLRAGARPFGEKTELGLYGTWRDGLKPGDAEAWGLGGYATYDVADGEFAVAQFKVPITWYVGGMAGFLSPTDEFNRKTIDQAASLLTGLSFGGEKVRIGVEYQYGLSPDLWKPLADVDPQGMLLLCLSYRF